MTSIRGYCPESRLGPAAVPARIFDPSQQWKGTCIELHRGSSIRLGFTLTRGSSRVIWGKSGLKIKGEKGHLRIQVVPGSSSISTTIQMLVRHSTAVVNEKSIYSPRKQGDIVQPSNIRIRRAFVVSLVRCRRTCTGSSASRQGPRLGLDYQSINHDGRFSFRGWNTGLEWHALQFQAIRPTISSVSSHSGNERSPVPQWVDVLV